MILARRQKITIAFLIVYWIVLAVVAHIPIPEVVYKARVSDKWLHFLAYLNLVFLLWFAVRPDSKVRLRNGMVWLVFLMTAAYGGIDELLQPYVGRTKDLGDFLANIAGVSAGLILFAFLAFWQALPAVLAITIFGLTNLAKANLSTLVPIWNTLFHFFAYGCLALVWCRVMKQCFFYKSVVATFGAPFCFLLAVKASSLLLGRHFAVTDLLFAVCGIIAALVICRMAYKAGRL
jgi:hypothetical protein